VTGLFLTKDGPIDVPERVLVVVAHPDDIDFGLAGTVARLTSAGSHVAYCLVTSGEAGEDDMTFSSGELASMREAEQKAAAGEVGVANLHWLHHPDGFVKANFDLRRDISRVIRIERPDVVISQSPERNYDSVYGSHPDHLETGEATLRAVYPDSRNPRAFTSELLDEGYEPHTVNNVWVSQIEPDLFADITDVFQQKLRALRSHASQVAKRDAEFDLEKLMREWGERIAATATKGGVSYFDAEEHPGRLAEGFRVLNSV
jgi:LmbE family N-acetylglucosaminyl deacetylase